VGRDLQDVLEALLDGVVVVDGEGRVELLNAEACRMLETSAEAACGQPLERVMGDPRYGEMVRAVLESGRALVEGDHGLERRFDEDVVVDVAASPLWGEGRARNGVVLALRDRTIHRTLEERVTERERLSLYGTIAAGIAHEVKNPLGGIRGAAEILGARSGEGKLRDAAQLIVREVDRIRLLVDELMVFKEGEALRLTPVNVHRVLDDVLDLLSMDPLAAGVKLERSFDPSIPDLRADSDRLVQVFLNLARNALQALEGRGTLRIQTRMALDRRLTATGGASVPTVLVTFEDDGPGIPADTLELLSTPFFTTRFGGTGLGLAVSRHWVALHGGALRLESEPGAGTRAHVSLPVSGPPEIAEGTS